MEAAQNLNGFDWLVVVLVAIPALLGMMRGFTREAISLAAWVLAAVVVHFFHKPATLWLAPRVSGESWAAIIAFIGLFFGVVFVARIIASLAGGAARRSSLSPIDRLLGLGFGGLKGVILASVAFLLVQFTSVFDAERQPPDWLLNSRSAPLLAMTSGAMVGWVRDLDTALNGAPGQATDNSLNPGFPFPPEAILPPGHPGLRQNQPERDGYSRSDREALDKLLDQQAKNGQVEI